MKRFTFTLAFFALAMLLALAVGPTARLVKAQDAEGAMIVCDGDLILSLYFAEHDYNFAAIYDELMVSMPDMALPSLEAFDKGQYAPLFDSMMSMMAEDMSMPESMMSEEMAAGVMGMMMDEAMMMEAMPEGAEGMTELAPLAVEGEPAECAALRTELHNFYSAIAFYSSMMMEETGS